MDSFYIDTTCNDVSGFDSNRRVFNEYLWFQSDTAVMHYIMESATDRLVAYFSLTASSVLFGDPNNLNTIPAIELKMFALDKNYQGAGMASVLLDAVIKTIIYYSKEYIGADVIILYSVPVDHVIQLYESKGFIRIGGVLTAFRSNFTEGCVPMFLEI